MKYKAFFEYLFMENTEEFIKKLEEKVKEELYGEPTGHDYYHSLRVMKLAEMLIKHEMKKGRKIDVDVVKIATLIHDLKEEKFHKGSQSEYISQLLKEYGVEEEMINKVVKIIKEIPYRGKDTKKTTSIEAAIIRDADWLDALGVIGIARTHATAAKLNQMIYDPERPPKPEMNEKEYRKRETTAINHYYEKLLKLPEMMETEGGKKIAEERVEKMKKYLEWFFEEWNLEDAKRILNL